MTLAEMPDAIGGQTLKRKVLEELGGPGRWGVWVDVFDHEQYCAVYYSTFHIMQLRVSVGRNEGYRRRWTTK